MRLVHVLNWWILFLRLSLSHDRMHVWRELLGYCDFGFYSTLIACASCCSCWLDSYLTSLSPFWLVLLSSKFKLLRSHISKRHFKIRVTFALDIYCQNHDLFCGARSALEGDTSQLGPCPGPNDVEANDYDLWRGRIWILVSVCAMQLWKMTTAGSIYAFFFGVFLSILREPLDPMPVDNSSDQ